MDFSLVYFVFGTRDSGREVDRSWNGMEWKGMKGLALMGKGREREGKGWRRGVVSERCYCGDVVLCSTF